jgi:hypothetical protein
MPLEADRDTDLRVLPAHLRAHARPALLAAALLAAAFGGLGAFGPAPVAGAADSVAVVQELPLAPAPPSGVTAVDVPNDRGEAVLVSWKLSPDEAAHPERMLLYMISRADAPGGPFVLTDSVAAGRTEKTIEGLHAGKAVVFRVAAKGLGGASEGVDAAGATPAAQWFNSTRLSVFIAVVLFFTFVLWFISRARGGKAMFVRRIPGIDAIEEAIGRATEMGRSVLYVPGINDIDDIQTMASLTILESVAKMTAKYETPIVVPTTYPVVFTLAQEMVKNGYISAGRADAFDPNSVRYVTSEQFAYVAAVNGIMLRDKPAANIYLGSFFAESLLLAETGFATKAIQVAGTAQVAQLPFFVVACDYTLIGEELYAASAYLSHEPRLLGSLKGSDVMKVLLILVIVVGCILETAGIHWFTQFMTTQ